MSPEHAFPVRLKQYTNIAFYGKSMGFTLKILLSRHRYSPSGHCEHHRWCLMATYNTSTHCFENKIQSVKRNLQPKPCLNTRSNHFPLFIFLNRTVLADAHYHQHQHRH